MAVILRSNYHELIPVIKEKLKAATFVCFDAEYSGLHHPPVGTATSLFDTGPERYEKMRGIVMHNTAPQIGFCIFTRDPDATKHLYHVDAYQAYVLEPSFGGFRSSEIALSLEYKCGKFLRKCNFDFNSLKEHSVPCLNQNRVEELKQYLDANPDFMHLKGRYFDKIFFPEVKTFHDETEKNTLIQRLRGLCEILDVITEYKIPIVGHNMALDVLYFFRLLCSDLPEDYAAFKKSAAQALPSVYDTKYMIASCRKMLNHPAFKNNEDQKKLESSSLFTAYLNTSSVDDKFKPKIMLNETCSRFKESILLGTKKDLEEENNLLIHDPTFDACITGILFLNIGHISARIDKKFNERLIPTSVEDMFTNVQAWKDQIYIARATVITMRLQGNDPKPSRPEWIKVSAKTNIYAEDLRTQLSSFGPVDVEQADEKTVRLAAAGNKSARQIMKLLVEQGFFVEKVDIPWVGKPKHTGLGRHHSDKIYDRSKLLG